MHTFHRVAGVSDGVDTLDDMFNLAAWAGDARELTCQDSDFLIAESKPYLCSEA
jgi:hypothetical protein